jgi:DNA-binding NtrC family response regulator
MKGESFDLIITDNRMPCLLGLEVLAGLQKNKNFPPLILITAFGDAATYREAREIGVAAVFDKPFELEDLSRTIQRTLQSRKETKN